MQAEAEAALEAKR
jgi:colicin import membrane protein